MIPCTENSFRRQVFVAKGAFAHVDCAKQVAIWRQVGDHILRISRFYSEASCTRKEVQHGSGVDFRAKRRFEVGIPGVRCHVGLFEFSDNIGHLVQGANIATWKVKISLSQERCEVNWREPIGIGFVHELSDVYFR